MFSIAVWQLVIAALFALMVLLPMSCALICSAILMMIRTWDTVKLRLKGAKK